MISTENTLNKTTKAMAVKLTSIFTFWQKKPELLTITAAVGIFILQETKAGRPCWIRKIATSADKIGFQALSQTGTASARINDLRKKGIEIDGTKYVIHDLQPGKCHYSKRMVEMFCLIKAGEAVDDEKLIWQRSN